LSVYRFVIAAGKLDSVVACGNDKAASTKTCSPKPDKPPKTLKLKPKFMELTNLKSKVDHYKEVLKNTENYRKAWQTDTKPMILKLLESIANAVKLKAKIEEVAQLENMEAITLSLGTSKSGLSKKIEKGIELPLVKNGGTLIYQQLFNGKVMVIIQYPHIESYGQPRPPKTVAIYRPEELKEPYIIRHFEEFIQEITNWEDFDDDEPTKKIGFEMNFGSLKPETK